MRWRVLRKLPSVLSAKSIRVAPITSADARRIIARYHYSGKCVQNSQLHFGVFLDNKLLGAMQFGPPMDKRKLIPLVKNTQWNGMLELNRMAFADALPRNSESRALAVAMRMIRKHYPHVEWIVSFADGTQCGDGTIYRAAGFVLSGIRISKNLAQLPDGSTIHKLTLEANPTAKRSELNGKSYYEITNGRYDFAKYVATTNGKILPGFQLRYIYFLNPEARQRLTCPILPFSTIEKHGAKMYRGVRARSTDSGAADDQLAGGGANPTRALAGETGNKQGHNAESTETHTL